MRTTGAVKPHSVCMSLRRSVSAKVLFMEGVTRSAYKIARPASCLVALPIVCSNAVSLRRNPSASASSTQTRDTSGRLRPWNTQGGLERAEGGGRRGRRPRGRESCVFCADVRICSTCCDIQGEDGFEDMRVLKSTGNGRDLTVGYIAGFVATTSDRFLPGIYPTSLSRLTPTITSISPPRS